MLKTPQLTLDRVRQFSQRTLMPLLYPDKAPVQIAVFHAPDRISYDLAMQGQYAPTTVGQRFGPLWSTHWFRIQIQIPEGWSGKEVHFLFDSMSEAQVWQDGRPMQGLTGSMIGWGAMALRPEYILTRKAKGGEQIELYVEMAVNQLFGIGEDTNDSTQLGTLRQCEIAVFDRDAWDLLWDFKVIADMAELLPEKTPRQGQALFAANSMVNQILPDDRKSWAAARKTAADFLRDHNGDGQLNLSAIGHAHIDTAWLWPLAETQRKCVRTFSSAVLYMDDYPEYKFACSQAQQYEWIKEQHPDLYARIQEKVKDGQFIPVGGSWVEPDCNLPSGEALVRQFLYGQRLFEREFGKKCEEFWEPDVFGYSAALPQILRGVGIKYFLTIKLSWNQFNKLASHTFYWEGLDGSQVLTHFPPADNYNAMADVKETLYSMTNYKDLDRSKEAYMLFGFGDGGGGPTRFMLEQAKRLKDVDGMPRVEMRTSNDFFKRLEKGIKDPTTWVGELYFELHRGTYTTQANNKKYNRRSEWMLHDVEFLSAVAHTLRGAEYPHGELDRLWKLVLTSQFHDIIPGSSIDLVYQDSNVHYQDVLGSGAAMRNSALVSLLGRPASQAGNVAVVNTTAVERHEVIELPEGSAAAQTGANGKPLGIASAPAYGYAVFTPQAASEQSVQVQEQGKEFVLENEYVRAVFQKDGSLTSLFDKTNQRESIQPGASANRFVIYDDEPNNWDAWDVDIFHLEKRLAEPQAQTASVSETGPLRASLTFTYALSDTSTLKQTVSLSAVSPRLDFESEVSWHERHRFLKVEFPLNVRAQNATYEIQFGHVQRPTHFNTSWDWARFEVPAHRWGDLSDPYFGVALLNDSKYGYATHGNVMRLSLLRAPTSPDPTADQGDHIFRYALLPHAGGPQIGGVIEEGYRLNVPLLVFPTESAPTRASYFQVDNPALILDTVKKAEDSNDLIIRLYEARGTQGSARITTSLPLEGVRACNLLEEATEFAPVQVSSGGFTVDFRPFQLLSFQIKTGERA